MKVIDITGQRFGRLVALRQAAERVGPKQCIGWVCSCDCGNEIVVRGYSLRDGNTKSCGCLFLDSVITHGHTRGRQFPATYRSWDHMIQRCTNPSYLHFHYYGGRGIKVCERWMTYENFLADMGDRPNGTSLDRIDVNGNYEPGNCRWATRQQQANNTRRNTMITYAGRTMSISDWSREMSLTKPCISGRLKRKWPIEKVLTTPMIARSCRPGLEK